MRNYKIELTPVYEEDGNTSWMATVPTMKGVVGGGDTPEEAVKELNDNIEMFIEFSKSEGLIVAEEYKEPEFSGKLSLRIPRTLHESLSLKAKEEGISLNSYIQFALSHFDGKEDALEVIDIKLREYNQKMLETYAYVVDRVEGDYNEKYSYGS